MVRSVPALWLVIALVFVAPPAAQAASFLDIDWKSSAEFFTLFPVEVRISGTRTGHGVLALSRPTELDGGFFFEFSGPGGSRVGQTLADATILPGQFGFPLPPRFQSGPGLRPASRAGC